MRETTHYAFSIGVSFYILSLLRASTLTSEVASVWLSFVVNFTVDSLGHVSRNGIPTRSRITHSLFTAPVWGGLVALASTSAWDEAIGMHVSFSTLLLWTTLGVLIAVGHLLLDSLTQAGVYSLRRRVALAHFSYDNPVLNAGFVLVGVILFVASLA